MNVRCVGWLKNFSHPCATAPVLTSQPSFSSFPSSKHSHFLSPHLFMFLCLESTQLLIIQGISISKFRVELKENVCLVPCQFSLLLLYLFPAATSELCERSEDTSGLTEIQEKWGVFCSFCFCAQHAWE